MAPESILYGRRHGHRLRASRRALLDEVLPAVAIDLPGKGDLPGEGGRLDLAGLFAALPQGSRPLRYRLEVGFGNGEHLVAQAAAHPEIGFIGCEPFINGVSMCLHHLKQAGVGNVRLHADDARPLMAMLPDAALERVSVLFPDPWPKTRHHRRRFIGPETLDLLARVLAPGGELRIATDHMECGRWMLDHGCRHAAFAWLAEGPGDWRRPPEDESPSRYEEKAQAAGRPCIYLQFRRLRVA